MSTDKQTKATTAAIAKYDAPAGFVEIDVDLPSFKAELFTQRREGTPYEDYTGAPILGTILECRDLGDSTDPETGETIVDEETGEARRLRGLVIELEAPVKVQGRDKSQPAFEAKTGDKILFFPTFKVKQAILAVARPPAALAQLDMDAKVEMACNHPTKMLRLWVMPTTRGPHPTDSKKRLWNYKILVDPKLRDRKGVQAMGGQLFDQVSVLPPVANGRGEHLLPAHGQG